MLSEKNGTNHPLFIHPGHPWPLGSSITKRGVNFSVAAPNATEIQLVLFKNETDQEPNQIIPLKSINKSGEYWHIEIEGLGEGCLYGFKVFNSDNHNISNASNKILLDPCARAIGGWNTYNRNKCMGTQDNKDSCLKSIVCERNEFDFNSHPRPKHKWENTVIYELHLGGFTKGKESNISLELQGTFLGLKEKIPYLRDLGITTIELLPIFSFDISDAPYGKQNFWGYSPINWFTPHNRYVAGNNPLLARNQVRDLVAACHDNEIEVILDVVYNHTSEGGKNGPIISWKGFGDDIYYHKNEKSEYLDVTGCGNTIAANHPIVRKLIIESMKCWTIELGIDGFRFDLGVALTRGKDLMPLENPPLFEEIEAEPEFSEIKLISEPWDCGGLYKIDNFPARKVSTWNGHFRDDIRKFWKGDKSSTWPLKSRLNGSQDIYNLKESTHFSINFITSHDGFTLNDLVSFNAKHNYANGEGNRDGENHNNSWNHGIEGPTNDNKLILLRNRQKRNMMTTLLLSPGVPMLLMGDEFNRSQGGNNNTWCQDNPLGWMIWDHLSCDHQMQQFVQKVLRLRKNFPELFSPKKVFHDYQTNTKDTQDYFSIRWHGIKLNNPDWSNWSHTISYSIHDCNQLALAWIALNSYSKPMKFEIPETESEWVEHINTSYTNHEDLTLKTLPKGQKDIEVINKSLVVALSKEYSERILASSS